MKSFVRLTDFSKEELQEIFSIADNIGEYKNFLREKTVVLFFPSTSLRTRVSFEKGIHLLGGQAILFEPSTLEKKEDIRDVCGYLQNWADAAAEDAINSPFFVGYEFKKRLLAVQQAILIYCMRKV